MIHAKSQQADTASLNRRATRSRDVMDGRILDSVGRDVVIRWHEFTAYEGCYETQNIQESRVPNEAPVPRESTTTSA